MLVIPLLLFFPLKYELKYFSIAYLRAKITAKEFKLIPDKELPDTIWYLPPAAVKVGEPFCPLAKSEATKAPKLADLS